MSLSNLSHVNERLIDLISHNLNQTNEADRLSRLYFVIINNTLLDTITTYEEHIKISPDDLDAINRHGSTSYTLRRNYPAKDKNIAKALRILRKHLPYSQAKVFASNPAKILSDSFYHVIDSFKWECNSNFEANFDLKKA